MKVTYTVPSSYTISIPSSITVGESAIVSASEVLLGEGDTLSVSVSSTQYANDSWQLKNGDNSIPYTIKNGEQSISNNATVLTATNGQNPSVTLTTALAEPSKPLSYAGNYTDTLVFSVEAGPVIDLSKLTETYVIKDSKTYTFTGSGSHGIRVESGEPTIKLVNASISADWNGIDVIGGSATIHVTGSSFVQGYSGAGICVVPGKTITITGNSRADKLTAQGNVAGAGIGGGSGSPSCGTITIDHVTVYAYAGGTSTDSSAAIGAAIGGGFGRVYIQNGADVYVCKAPYGDYIGYSGDTRDPAGGHIYADIDSTSSVTKLN